MTTTSRPLDLLATIRRLADGGHYNLVDALIRFATQGDALLPRWAISSEMGPERMKRLDSHRATAQGAPSNDNQVALGRLIMEARTDAIGAVNTGTVTVAELREEWLDMGSAFVTRTEIAALFGAVFPD